MNPVCYSSAPRRESCLVKGPVFGQNIYRCPLSSLDGSMSTAGLIHTNGSHDCCSGPGCGLVPTTVTCWPQGKNSQRGELLRVQSSSSENSLVHRSSCVITCLLTVCFHADSAFHEIMQFSGQLCTLLFLQHIGCFSLPQEECTNP